MKKQYNNRQRKIFSDYSNEPDAYLSEIIENQSKYLPEVISVIADILEERKVQKSQDKELGEDKVRTIKDEEIGNVRYVKAYKENFFSPQGRIGRDKYFLRSILLNIPWALFYVDISAFSESPGTHLMILLLLFTVLVCRLIQTAKRFHDFNASGWHFIWTMIPLVSIILWFVLIFTKGSPKENKYGPPPSISRHFKS